METDYSIYDLPLELIFEIVQLVGFEDSSATCFALTCRNFYDIAMTEILEDHRKHLWKMATSACLTLFDESTQFDSLEDYQALGQVINDCNSELKAKIPTKLVYHNHGRPKDLHCVHRLLHS